jgi:hypothetical protein
MAISIDTGKIGAVLLGDGKWHAVKEGTFDIGSYEFREGNRLVLGGGGAANISETGATCDDPHDGERYTCPLSSILAVNYRSRFE